MGALPGLIERLERATSIQLEEYAYPMSASSELIVAANEAIDLIKKLEKEVERLARAEQIALEGNRTKELEAAREVIAANMAELALVKSGVHATTSESRDRAEAAEKERTKMKSLVRDMIKAVEQWQPEDAAGNLLKSQILTRAHPFKGED